MDTFGSAYLSGVVQNLKRPQLGLLTMFFGEIAQSTDEKVYFDVEDGKRRIAPFVSPLVEGKLVESLGYTTNSFEPAYVKDKRVFSPNAPLRRRAGEQIGGSTTPMDRVRLNLAREMQDQVDMLNRRQEVMASEVLRTGKLTIEGKGYPQVVLDFGRPAGHTIALGAGNRWGDAGIDPLASIEDWSDLVANESGYADDAVVMDRKAWRLFRNNVDLDKLFDKARLNTGASMQSVLDGAEGLKYMGNDGVRSYYVYSGKYIPDGSSTETNIIPDNTVLVGSAMGVAGVRHFGAIRDEAAGYQAMEYFPKSWLEQDPSVRYLLMQSAPVVVPYRPGAIVAATVAV